MLMELCLKAITTINSISSEIIQLLLILLATITDTVCD